MEQGLPNAQVNTLEYVPANPNHPNADDPLHGDLLLVGTYGRGAWEIANASQYLAGPPGQANISAQNGTIVLRTDPLQPNNSQVLMDAPGASVAQVIQDNNVQMEEPWLSIPQLGIYAGPETVDILNVAPGVNVAVDGSAGANVVNVGSAANQLNTIVGNVNVINCASTTLNVNDQGDATPGTWTVGNAAVAWTNGSGASTTIGYALTGLVVNAGSNVNTFAVNDIGAFEALTVNTGAFQPVPFGAINLVTLNDPAPYWTFNLNDDSQTKVLVQATGMDSTTNINSSSPEIIRVGNNHLVNGIQGAASTSCGRVPSMETPWSSTTARITRPKRSPSPMARSMAWRKVILLMHRTR